MSQRMLRAKHRISYYEPEEPNLDEYVFCETCADYVYEYCAIHGPLLVIPDSKVPARADVPPYLPRAALTIPSVFLHLACSTIPGAGIGVFATLTLPSGVRFGPYRGQRTNNTDTEYGWQIYDNNRKALHCVDAADPGKSNWMRYVNCARHWHEQNLIAYQYQGQLYYRTIKIIPRFTELMVFYGNEFANELDVDLARYNSPSGYAQKYGAPAIKKRKFNDHSPKTHTEQDSHKKKTTFINTPTTKQVITTETIEKNKSTDNKTSTDVSANQAISIKWCDKNGINKNDSATETKRFHENGVRVKTVSISNDLKPHTGEKLYKCDVCNKALTRSSNMKSHMRTHKGEKPYKCEVCNEAFTESGNMKSHMRTHTGEKPYKCEVCNEAFTESGNMKSHMRTHTGEKPYKCEVCNEAFTERGSMKSHMRTHTGEKPYKCEVCNKAFTQSSNMKSHMRTHTGEKPYKCEVCNKAFTQSSNMKTHMRTHTGEKPYKCEVCNEAFTERGSMKSHMRTHTGEKPYKCEVCNKAFTQSSNMKSHMKTHTGEKPFNCEICDRSFSYKIALEKHLILHLKKL